MDAPQKMLLHLGDGLDEGFRHTGESRSGEPVVLGRLQIHTLLDEHRLMDASW